MEDMKERQDAEIEVLQCKPLRRKKGVYKLTHCLQPPGRYCWLAIFDTDFETTESETVWKVRGTGRL